MTTNPVTKSQLQFHPWCVLIILSCNIWYFHLSFHSCYFWQNYTFQKSCNWKLICYLSIWQRTFWNKTRMLFSLTKISLIFEVLEGELQGISHYCTVLCKSKNLWQRKLVLFFTFHLWGKLMCRGIKKFVHDQGQQQQ